MRENTESAMLGLFYREAEKANAVADRAKRQAELALRRRKPATPAGAAALVRYVLADLRDGGSGWAEAVLKNIAAGLDNLAKVEAK